MISGELENIENLAKLLFRSDHKFHGWDNVTGVERNHYINQAKCLIENGYGLKPCVSPHKLYEMSKGDSRIYRNLMMAHGYLMLKRTHSEIPTIEKLKEIATNSLLKKYQFVRLGNDMECVIKSIYGYLTNAETTP